MHRTPRCVRVLAALVLAFALAGVALLPPPLPPPDPSPPAAEGSFVEPAVEPSRDIPRLPLLAAPAATAARVAGSIDWVAELEGALAAGHARRAEAARSALRHLYVRRPALAGEHFVAAVPPHLRAEIAVLAVDVGGPTAWDRIRPLADDEDTVAAAVAERLCRAGSDGQAALAGDAVPGFRGDRAAALARRLLRQRTPGSFAAALRLGAPRSVVARRALDLHDDGLRAPELSSLMADLLRGEPDFRVRDDLLAALADLLPSALAGPPASTAELFQRARSPDPVVAARALAGAGALVDALKAGSAPPEEIIAVRGLIRETVFSGVDPILRRAAVLSRVGVVLDATLKMDEAGAQCRLLLELARQDPDAGVRAAAIQRIVRGTARQGLPFPPSAFRSFLFDDPDPGVRAQAFDAVVAAGERPAHREEARRLALEGLSSSPRLRSGASVARGLALLELDLPPQGVPLEGESGEDRAWIEGDDPEAATPAVSPEPGFRASGPRCSQCLDVSFQSGTFRLRGWLRLCRGAPLVVVAGPGLLVGGSPLPFAHETLDAIADRLGISLLQFDWRGRGRSEGFFDSPGAPAEDLRSAVRFAATGGEDPAGRVADFPPPAAMLVLGFGPGAGVYHRASLSGGPEAVGSVLVNAMEVDTESDLAAYNRALGRTEEPPDAAAVEARLREALGPLPRD